MADVGDDDPVILGRRATDGSYLSFREAIRLFATKEELAGMHTAMTALISRVDALVPRHEHELHWQHDDERFALISKSLKEMTLKIEDLRANRMPPWMLPFFGVVSPLIAVVIGHFWR